MGKVFFAINLSIDGCCDHMSFRPDEDTFVYFNDLMHQADLTAYGRKMFEIIFPYWAEDENRESELENDFGERITGMEKIVFSRTLQSADYNTRIVRTDPIKELLKLKQESDKNIYVGTLSMLPQLMQHGVIDEYHLVVTPVIVGHGPHLVEGGSLPEVLKLKLIGSKFFKSGAFALHYAKG